MHERVAIVLLNFGEPASADAETVTRFLERIFLANARLEPGLDPAGRRRRSRRLAERRAPGLIADYERIGGSPLQGQARAQAEGLRAALAKRGVEAIVEVGMQFTEPSIEASIARLRSARPSLLVALPVYPLCGPSTTVASLAEVSAVLERSPWAPEVCEVSGWHRHPGYVRLRADATLEAARGAGLDLSDPSVRLVFSAHGTPLTYVREGSRYPDYVEEWCSLQAAALGLERWTLGYQNHANRGVEWTKPDVEAAIESLGDATDILVDPVSFMHEQSETLVELDIDLAGRAAELGLGFHRVTIPHDAEAFMEVLADLAQTAMGQEVGGVPAPTACCCRPEAGVCFNGAPVAAPRRAGNTP